MRVRASGGPEEVAPHTVTSSISTVAAIGKSKDLRSVNRQTTDIDDLLNNNNNTSALRCILRWQLVCILQPLQWMSLSNLLK